MIFFSPPEIPAAPNVSVVLREEAFTIDRLRGSIEDCGGLGPEIGFDADNSDSVQSQPETIDTPEEFDWSVKNLKSQFVMLEQKVLAGKATSEERQRYEAMRASWNKIVFADRHIQDYAETQRLKKLCEKLAEVQRYLRPIRT